MRFPIFFSSPSLKKLKSNKNSLNFLQKHSLGVRRSDCRLNLIKAVTDFTSKVLYMAWICCWESAKCTSGSYFVWFMRLQTIKVSDVSFIWDTVLDKLVLEQWSIMAGMIFHPGRNHKCCRPNLFWFLVSSLYIPVHFGPNEGQVDALSITNSANVDTIFCGCLSLPPFVDPFSHWQAPLLRLCYIVHLCTVRPVFF